MAVYTEISALFKDLMAVADKTKNADLNNAVLNLQSMVMEQNAIILDLRQTLAAYEEQNNLESKIRLKNSVIEVGEDPQRYCVHCWGKERKLNPVTILRGEGQELRYNCATCHQHGIYHGSEKDITDNN